MILEDNKILYSYKLNIKSKKDIFLQKRSFILNSLSKKNLVNIYEVFKYSNMKKNNFSFCQLYHHNRVCHNIEHEKLSCFNCFCPNYVNEFFSNEKENQYYFGICKANSEFKSYTKYSKSKFSKELFILNCSQCLIPHIEEFF